MKGILYKKRLIYENLMISQLLLSSNAVEKIAGFKKKMVHFSNHRNFEMLVIQ